MLEFSLTIDLGKKERVDEHTLSMPVDRDFVARALTGAADEILAGKNSPGIILDEEGIEVGDWRFSLMKRAG
jgi:hypothetical protein